MDIEDIGRFRGAVLTVGRTPAAVLAAALALAGCAAPGAGGLGIGGLGTGSGGGTGTGATGQRSAGGGAVLTVPRLSMPIIQWPLGPGGTASTPGTAAPARGTAAAGGAAQVVDPFAGQGVAQPAIPGKGSVTKTAAAPAATRTGAGAGSGTRGTAAPQAAGSRTHTVAPGETAWSVAREYGVSIQDLARANGLPDSMNIRVGQRLAIPPAAGPAGAERVTAPGAGSPTPQPPSSSKPLPSEKTQPSSAPAPKSDVPNLGKSRTKASGNGKLAMPASGSIVRAYKKGTNEGIDISAAPGSTVSAAAGGTVAAVTRDTDGVPIVVVRHDSGLMTVYAGIDKLTVSKGDSVRRGQGIGAARSTGVVHFEVRNGFDSVDPETYL